MKDAENDWQLIKDGSKLPAAMHFLAAKFWQEGGEWSYKIVMSEEAKLLGFTHWRLLPEPPRNSI